MGVSAKSILCYTKQTSMDTKKVQLHNKYHAKYNYVLHKMYCRKLKLLTDVAQFKNCSYWNSTKFLCIEYSTKIQGMLNLPYMKIRLDIALQMEHCGT